MRKFSFALLVAMLVAATMVGCKPKDKNGTTGGGTTGGTTTGDTNTTNK